VLSISNYEISHNETYHEFYTRLIKQQMDNLLSAGSKVSGSILDKDEVLTKSHQMLICVLWLEKIDARLPRIVQSQYGAQLKTGTNIIDLVPVLCEEVENLINRYALPSVTNKYIKSQDVNEVQIKHEQIEIEDDNDNDNEFKIDLEKAIEEKVLIEKNLENASEDREKNGLQNNFENNYEDWSNKEQYCGDDHNFNVDKKSLVNELFTSTTKESISVKRPKRGKGLTTRTLKVRRKKENIDNKKEGIKLSKSYKSSQTFNCDICQQYSTKWTGKFRRHMRDMNGKCVKFCKECDKFDDGNDKNSVSVHSSNMECKECGQILKTCRLFKVHQFKVHNIGAALQCALCPYQTAIKVYFNAHMRTTHGEGFICTECGEKFTHKSAYKCHMKFKHEGAKEFCDQCDFVSTTRDGLSYHVKTVHLGLKAVICKICGVKLNRQRELRTHMATIHGSGKYWSCSKCDYNATTKQLLQEHDRKVHERIFFECDHCPSKFVRKYALRRHLENVHKILGVKRE